MPTERSPLLWNESVGRSRDIGDDVHTQFCSLVGCPPSNAPIDYHHHVNKKSLYGRATSGLAAQNRTYIFSASLSNTLLLSQVVLGAALTGLGASESAYLLITLFGAANTIIAGLVAYLKSRGQPMRSRMYRDDLERIVDEIENSEVMWLGISKGVHGYDDIDTDEVTVRSEVARLTRLYDRAVKTNTMNNPDMYSAGGFDSSATSGLRKAPVPQPALPAATVPAADPAPVGNSATTAPVPVQPPPAVDPDQSPASQAPKPKETPKPDPPKETLESDEAKEEKPKADVSKNNDEESVKDKNTDTDASSSDAVKKDSDDTITKEDKSDGRSNKEQTTNTDDNAASSTTTAATAAATPTQPQPQPTAPIPVDVDESPATRPRFASSRKESKSSNNTTTKTTSSSSKSNSNSNHSNNETTPKKVEGEDD